MIGNAHFLASGDFDRLSQLGIPPAAGMLMQWDNPHGLIVDGFELDKVGQVRVDADGWRPPRELHVAPVIQDLATRLILLHDLGQRLRRPVAVSPGGTWSMLAPTLPHSHWNQDPIEALVLALEETVAAAGCHRAIA